MAFGGRSSLLSQEQTGSQSQQQKIDPKIILANTLLQLSSLELQQTVEQEVAENPALDLEDEQPCSGCELSPFLCKDCQYSPGGESVSPQFESVADDLEYSYGAVGEPDDERDPLAALQAELTLREHLSGQLRNVASGKLYEIGDYLINYINESGYLVCDPLELTLELDATEDEICEAIRLLQTLDPPGIAARDLHECMLIQMLYLAEEGRGNPIAERIVRDCWDEMTSHKYTRIARRLKVKSDAVSQAIEFIQAKLNPYPATGFRSPWDYSPSDNSMTVRPDVVIHRTSTGYEVEIVANERLSIAINPHYRALYNQLKSMGARKYSEEDRRYIIEAVERAELLMKNLTQRRKTLRSITKCIVEYQHGFLATGAKLFLRPFTRVMVAEMLRMHESTVSRATASKYVQLPSQEVVPFDLFFQNSHSVMDMIAQLMSCEDAGHPMSDQEIADTLAERGHPIARRTVAKYRNALKILPSHDRRR